MSGACKYLNHGINTSGWKTQPPRAWYYRNRIRFVEDEVIAFFGAHRDWWESRKKRLRIQTGACADFSTRASGDGHGAVSPRACIITMDQVERMHGRRGEVDQDKYTQWKDALQDAASGKLCPVQGEAQDTTDTQDDEPVAVEAGRRPDLSAGTMVDVDIKLAGLEGYNRCCDTVRGMVLYTHEDSVGLHITGTRETIDAPASAVTVVKPPAPSVQYKLFDRISVLETTPGDTGSIYWTVSGTVITAVEDSRVIVMLDHATQDGFSNLCVVHSDAIRHTQRPPAWTSMKRSGPERPKKKRRTVN